MNIIEKYLGEVKFIGSLSRKDFEDILEMRHPNIHIANTVPGAIVLSDRKTIGCVKDYYVDKNREGLKINSNSGQACFATQTFFKLPVVPYSCRQCHLSALDKYKEGEILLK